MKNDTHMNDTHVVVPGASHHGASSLGTDLSLLGSFIVSFSVIKMLHDLLVTKKRNVDDIHISSRELRAGLHLDGLSFRYASMSTEAILSMLSVGPVLFVFLGLQVGEMFGLRGIEGISFVVSLFVFLLVLVCGCVAHIFGALASACLLATLGSQRRVNRVVLLSIICLCACKDHGGGAMLSVDKFAASFLFWFWTMATVFRLIKLDAKVLAVAIFISVFFFRVKHNLRAEEARGLQILEVATKLRQLQDAQKREAAGPWW